MAIYNYMFGDEIGENSIESTSRFEAARTFIRKLAPRGVDSFRMASSGGFYFVDYVPGRGWVIESARSDKSNLLYEDGMFVPGAGGDSMKLDGGTGRFAGGTVKAPGKPVRKALSTVPLDKAGEGDVIWSDPHGDWRLTVVRIFPRTGRGMYFAILEARNAAGTERCEYHIGKDGMTYSGVDLDLRYWRQIRSTIAEMKGVRGWNAW